MHCFGLNTLSIECLACYLSGYHLEDFLIDLRAEFRHCAPLCAPITRLLWGAIDSGAGPGAKGMRLPHPCPVTVNLNTFRVAWRRRRVCLSLSWMFPTGTMRPRWSTWPDILRILSGNWKIGFGKTFDEEKLKKALEIENETRKELVHFFRLQSEYYYPGELISHLYMMMGMHLLIGTQDFLDLIRFMVKDIQTYPKFEGKKILWVHLLPFLSGEPS